MKGCDEAYAGALAGRLRRLEPSLPEAAVAVARRVAQCTLTQKHVCLDVAKAGRGAVAGEGEAPLPTVEELQSWVCDFPRVFGTPERDAAPLILEGSRLYLQRYYRAECRLATSLVNRRSSVVHRDPAPLPLTPLLDASQQKAVATILSHRLSVVTGGPGTGKTTLVCAALMAFLQRQPELKIVACAPTGKAQARLREAVEGGIQNPGLGTRKIAYATLHQLLGYNPIQMTYRHSGRHPVEADVVVLDEASMADMMLMERLMGAIPEATRIIVLGDPRQLAAVENGSVLRDLCDAWEGHSCVATLSTSHRFGADSAMARIQAALYAGDDDRVMSELRRTDEQFFWRETASLADMDRAMGDLLATCDTFSTYRDAETVTEALARFNTFRILSASRKGRYGVEAMNQWMMAHWGMKPYQHGYPVMVTVNDYDANLFNGDIGLCWTDKDGVIRVYFDGAHERGVSLSQLPEHEPVFAMTVHKAQGSGFDTVLVALPSEPSPRDGDGFSSSLLTRELLYTAITRARQRCILWGDESRIRQCCRRETLRMSGLREKLVV